MLKILAYLVFIFSAAFAAGGIVLSTRLRGNNRSDSFTVLLYFQIFIFTFGFYGIWGQVVIKALLGTITSGALLDRFTNISLLLGLPFLIFSWLMLTRFARDISGRPLLKRFTLWFLVVNFFLLFGVGFIMTREGVTRPEIIIKYYFIILNAVYTVISAIWITFPGHLPTLMHKYEGRIMASAIVMLMGAQCAVLGLYGGNVITGLIFIFLFFGGNCFIPVYLSYGTVLSIFMKEPADELSFGDFCRSFEITPRESEVVREICNGLSNKEISGKLFITLQTVKDHTHRIYIKTNVKSRVQLINLVKETRTPASSLHSPSTP